MRWTAALAHLGPFLACGLLLVAAVMGAWVDALEVALPGRRYERAGEVWLILVLGAPLLGPVAALVAARRSPWSAFLRSHGARALYMYGMTLCLQLLAIVCVAAFPHPVTALLGVLAAMCFVCVWFVVVTSAAASAQGGHLAWYPLASRILRDPAGYRTRKPLDP